MDHQAAKQARQSWQSPKIAQSRIYTISTIVNPLVAAASPLLALATELHHIKQAPDKDKLHTLLCHEIRTFEVVCTRYNYSPTIILAARYMLCALIDEILLQSHWGQQIQWFQQKLLSTIIKDHMPDDMFFLILEKSSQEPDRYLDIIELCYFCLCHGFKGKYVNQPSANDHLNQLMDKLYKIINQQRGEFSRQLVVNSEPLKQIKRRKTIWQIPPAITATLISISVLTVAFITYNHKLNKAAAPLTHVLNRLQQPLFKNLGN
ncbi:MAG: hypothetical protein A3F17_02415 [Gammaproteobacteria bacterium RIFCSPHIGHO2_12_FULL_41_15]|nr:MAG: hypothetical protein A3F17_02415 [Gammaproteobacteria bacterium RIFCSPHIGHO2_12_FULL_41_15]